MRRPRVVAGIVSIAGLLAACGAPDDGAEGASAALVGEPRPSGLLPSSTPHCDASADDDGDAQTMAHARSRPGGEPAPGEYSERYVEPSGSRTLAASVMPRRARQPNLRAVRTAGAAAAVPAVAIAAMRCAVSHLIAGEPSRLPPVYAPDYGPFYRPAPAPPPSRGFSRGAPF